MKCRFCFYYNNWKHIITNYYMIACLSLHLSLLFNQKCTGWSYKNGGALWKNKLALCLSRVCTCYVCIFLFGLREKYKQAHRWALVSFWHLQVTKSGVIDSGERLLIFEFNSQINTHRAVVQFWTLCFLFTEPWTCMKHWRRELAKRQEIVAKFYKKCRGLTLITAACGHVMSDHLLMSY